MLNFIDPYSKDTINAQTTKTNKNKKSTYYLRLLLVTSLSFTTMACQDYTDLIDDAYQKITDAYNDFTNDNPPQIDNPIEDLTLTALKAGENNTPVQINLNEVFDDPDNDNSLFNFSALSSNETLVNVDINQGQLNLTLQPEQLGTAEIIVSVTSNGKSVSDRFTLTVVAEDPVEDDQAPVVSDPIEDITLEEVSDNENNDPIVINLEHVFDDPDNENSMISFAVSSDNQSLVSANIEQNALNLAIQPEQFGIAEIEVTATSNGLSVSDKFQIIVTESTSTKAKVFLMAGQSNMVGQGRNSELVNIDNNLNQTRDDVFIASIISPNASFAPLQPGFGSNSTKFGVELKFGHVMGEVFEAPIYLFKAAKGGTTIEELNDWRPQQHGGDENNLYAQMIDGFNQFIATELEAKNIEYEIAGFIWFQGYNDAAQGFQATYQDNLSNLIDSVRSDLNLPELPVVITQINDIQGEKGEVVRQAQATIANATPLNTLVNTGDQRPYYHYGDRSYVVIGERIAQASLSLLQQPVAAHDTYTLTPNQHIEINANNGVLSNDSTQDFQAQLISNVNFGQLSFNSDGSFNYQPQSGFLGKDSFEYQISYANKHSNIAKVTLETRNPQNDLQVYFDFDGDKPLQDKTSGILAVVKKEGASLIEQGKIGQAMHFNGSGVLHYLEDYPIPSYLDLSSQRDFTFSVWVKSDDGQSNEQQNQEQIIMSNKYRFNSGSGWAITTGGVDSALQVYIGAVDHENQTKSKVRFNSQQGSISDSQWHHVALSVNFSNNKASLYLDAVLVEEKDITNLKGEINQFESAIGNGTSGGNNKSHGFIGNIDEIKIFNRALTEQDIINLAQ